jgi:potassium efflux system protein
MAHRRKPTLLLSAFISFSGALCHAQNGLHYQTYPTTVTPPSTNTTHVNPSQLGARIAHANGLPSFQWNQSNQGLDGWNALSEPSSHNASIYDPRRIDAARRSASHDRTKSFPGVPIVSELANTNASFANQWAELAEKINSLSVRLGDAQAKLESATRDYDEVGANLRQHGLTPTIGLLLSHKKSQLEDWQIDGSAGHSVNEEIQRSREKLLENEMVVYDGSDVTSQTAKILALTGYDSTRMEHASLTSQVETLLYERSNWLQLLTQGYSDYQQRLGEFDRAARALSKLTSDYRALINRQVTWIRSTDPLALADLRKFRTGLTSLFDARRSEDFGYSLSQKWKINPASGMMLLGTSLIIYLLRILAKSWLIGIGSRKRMREATASLRKCLASFLTPLVACAFPGILYLSARWLGTGFVTESTLHVSSGLYAASFVALVMEVPRQLLRRFGFVEKHLKIDLPRQPRAAVYLLVIGTGLVLSAYVVTLAELIDHGTWSGSVARFGFIASLLLVAWTAHLALKPKGGFLEPLIEKFAGSVLYRIRFLFYVLGVGFPLAMIALSVLGYEYTATEILKRAGTMFVSILIGATLWSAIKILTSGAWHTLTGTRDERRFDEYDEQPPARVSGTLAEQALELKHQMAFLSHCALVLAAIVGIGWLWKDIFPDVRMGNPVVWTVQGTVSNSMLDASGQTVSRGEVETTPITVLHLVLAGATLFVAFQLAKLLPAIFDALVLQRVSFDEAMEHLSLVLGRSLLFGSGCLIACRLVGLRWETIHWLAVGLTIGVGFALQDILRNLFGGLVVLFEKPARLGDLITVGNVTGRIAAQKLRTTVLTDEEGREVIIPNKNFVSQDVVNWLGAGRLQVIPIEVAVTRDERPADVCRMLQQLLVEQDDLLLSPAPQATLVCVSQKCQRIELRAWIEKDQDALRYRESLTLTVLNYLAEKNLLAPNQPRQLSLKEACTPDALGGLHMRKKRSA